jgi:hypothetical protein
LSCCPSHPKEPAWVGATNDPKTRNQIFGQKSFDNPTARNVVGFDRMLHDSLGSNTQRRLIRPATNRETN